MERLQDKRFISVIGGIVLILILLFVFFRGNSPTEQEFSGWAEIEEQEEQEEQEQEEKEEKNVTELEDKVTEENVVKENNAIEEEDRGSAVVEVDNTEKKEDNDNLTVVDIEISPSAVTNQSVEEVKPVTNSNSASVEKQKVDTGDSTPPPKQEGSNNVSIPKPKEPQSSGSEIKKIEKTLLDAAGSQFSSNHNGESVNLFVGQPSINTIAFSYTPTPNKERYHLLNIDRADDQEVVEAASRVFSSLGADTNGFTEIVRNVQANGTTIERSFGQYEAIISRSSNRNKHVIVHFK